MTSFSSWGPTDDGRTKPDVVAAGCEHDPLYDYNEPDKSIWSTYILNLSSSYKGMCGTSMATPAVAGSLALMLEDWRDTHTAEPLPSTMKAVLIQTATDLGNLGPDYSHGYGLIDVKDAVDLIDSDTANNDVILEESIVEQNDRDHFTVAVASGQELKITLVWDDYPGTPNADPALANDLDLIVRAPDGSTRFPWTLDPDNPGDPAETDQPDRLNNVEQVYVSSVPVGSGGTWRIEISGHEVPQPNQTYSLVTNNIPMTPVTKPSRFYVRDAEGHAVAWFSSLGNIALKGTLTQNTTPSPSPDKDEFMVRNATGDVAMIDTTNGNMTIKGSRKTVWEDPSGASDDFIIKNSSDEVVAYISESGDLYLKGELYENTNP